MKRAQGRICMQTVPAGVMRLMFCGGEGFLRDNPPESLSLQLFVLEIRGKRTKQGPKVRPKGMLRVWTEQE